MLVSTVGSTVALPQEGPVFESRPLLFVRRVYKFSPVNVGVLSGYSGSLHSLEIYLLLGQLVSLECPQV